jgi:nucleoid-associated protein YgaU
MGYFDTMFGGGAAAAAAVPANEQRFTELKAKYKGAFDAMEQNHVQLTDLHVDGNIMVINGVAPSDEALKAVWDQINAVDVHWSNELAATLTVAVLPQPETEPYTVVAGDSLWRIAQHKLGHGTEYMKIFYANRDKMETPNSVIHPGDILNVPKA